MNYRIVTRIQTKVNSNLRPPMTHAVDKLSFTLCDHRVIDVRIWQYQGAQEVTCKLCLMRLGSLNGLSTLDK